MPIKIRINSQKIYALIVSYMLAFPALLSLTNEVLNLVNIRTTFDTMIMYGFLYLVLIIGFRFILIRIKTLALDVKIICLVMLLLYLSTYLLFKENRDYLYTNIADYAENPVYYMFFYSLPGYVFVRQLKDYNYFEKITTIFAYIIVAFSIIVYFFSGDSSAAQYLTFSYNMLFHLLFLIYKEPKKYKLLHVLLIVMGIFVFVFGGSRGALISFLLTIVLIYVFRNRNYIKKVILGYIAIVAIIVSWGFRTEILVYIAKLLGNMGLSSRTLYFMLNGNIFEDIIRSRIYKTLLDHVDIWGHGLMGDRAILNGKYYAHNLFLEWLVDFGIIGGILLSVFVIVIVFRGIKSYNRLENLYILLLLANGLMELMFTGSYLNQEPALYVLLGLCMNSILRRRRNESLIN